MKFFVDTAVVSEIKDLMDYGLLDGVTTNPSLIAKSGRNFIVVITETCALVDGPVSAEVASMDFARMPGATVCRQIDRFSSSVRRATSAH